MKNHLIVALATISLALVAVPAAAQGQFDCNLSVDQDALKLTAIAGARTLNVTATCDWTISGVPDWVTVPGGMTGSGNAAIGLDVAANPYSYPRTGTIVLNEETIVITQQGNQFHGPDFNNDGRTDLLWLNRSSGVVFTSFGNGQGTSGGRHLTVEYNTWEWRIVASADANGDGYADLLWKHHSLQWTKLPNLLAAEPNRMYLQWVDSGGVSDGDAALVPQTGVVGFGQVVPFNGLFADVLLRDMSNGDLLIAAGTAPGSFGSSPLVLWSNPDRNWQVIAVDDFDGNGNVDVLLRHSQGTCLIVTTRTSYWYVQDSAVYHYEPDRAWQIVDTADLNGDAMADVIWRNTDGRVWVQLMNGFTPISSAVIWTEPDTNWLIKGTGDFNGDGKGDILWRHQTTGDVFVQLMDGTTVLSATVMHREPNLDWKLVAPNTSAASYSGDSRTP